MVAIFFLPDSRQNENNSRGPSGSRGIKNILGRTEGRTDGQR
jgi:hypothetical protein